MVPGVLRLSTSNKRKLEVIRARQNSLGSPSRKLEGIVLELGGERGTTLRVEMLTPGGSRLGVVLVKGVDRDVFFGLVLNFSAREDLGLHECVDLKRKKRRFDQEFYGRRECGV